MRGTYHGRFDNETGRGLVIDMGYDEGNVEVPVDAITYQIFGGIRTGARVNVQMGPNDHICKVSLVPSDE